MVTSVPTLTFAFAIVVGVPKADVAACPVTFTTAPATTLTDPNAEVVTNVAGVTFAFATTLTDPRPEVTTPTVERFTGNAEQPSQQPTGQATQQAQAVGEQQRPMGQLQ